jgi:hypothetical protein
LLQFHLTALVLGPLFAAAVGAGNPRWLTGAAAIAAVTSLIALALRFLQVSASDVVELRGTARLLSTQFSRLLVARGLLLTMGAVVLPLATVHPLGLWAALLLTLVAELVGRYLFFVTAVPRHMTAAYLGSVAA